MIAGLRFTLTINEDKQVKSCLRLIRNTPVRNTAVVYILFFVGVE